MCCWVPGTGRCGQCPPAHAELPAGVHTLPEAALDSAMCREWDMRPPPGSAPPVPPAPAAADDQRWSHPPPSTEHWTQNSPPSDDKHLLRPCYALATREWISAAIFIIINWTFEFPLFSAASVGKWLPIICKFLPASATLYRSPVTRESARKLARILTSTTYPHEHVLISSLPVKSHVSINIYIIVHNSWFITRFVFS